MHRASSRFAAASWEEVLPTVVALSPFSRRASLEMAGVDSLETAGEGARFTSPLLAKGRRRFRRQQRH
ncbi:hypothetical protein DAI22_05g080200 [Oryza sativa Japonica Group]|nr:hypothetical protein DAI22_05g080200 [Oryza sativa Japonica Group]